MNDLPFEVWSRCWWKPEADDAWGKVAAFLHHNMAETWAEGWYGVSEDERKDGRLVWQIRKKK